MNTPFGPAVNLGTLDNPNYAGAAGGVAYLRGIHHALQVLQDVDLVHEDSWPQHDADVQAVEALLKAPSPPDSASGRDPNPLVIHVAVGNNPEKADRT